MRWNGNVYAILARPENHARLALAALSLALTACTQPLWERCYLPDDCSAGLECSNEGDRSRQGLCLPPVAPASSTGASSSEDTGSGGSSGLTGSTGDTSTSTGDTSISTGDTQGDTSGDASTSTGP
jgi:hypothetical protein